MTRGWLAILTITAVVGAGAGAGTARFVAQRDATVSPIAVAAAAGAPGAAAGSGPGLAGGAGPGAAASGEPGAAAKPGGRGNAPTAGTVDKVDATTLTVRTQAGTVDVPLNEQTTLMRQTSVAPTDLKVGDNVFGRGEDVGGKLVVHQLQVVPPGGRGAAIAGLGGPPGGQGAEGAAAGGRGGQGGGGRGGQGGAGQAAQGGTGPAAQGGAGPGAQGAAAQGAQGAGGQAAQGGGQGAQRGGPGGGQGGRGQGGAGGQGADGAAGGGRAGQGGPGGFGGQGGQGIAGTLAKLDGKTITVTRPNGGEMTAILADDATIQRVAPATREELKAGQSIVVASPPSADGQPHAVITITSA